MEGERYVKVASRFFRVNPASGGGGGAMIGVHHYLESCFLCKKNISCNRDIFMYKGNAAFCSEECRQEQIGMDEALHAAARRQRRLLHCKPPSSSAAAELAATERRDDAVAPSRPPMMHRRPTITSFAARTPMVAS